MRTDKDESQNEVIDIEAVKLLPRTQNTRKTIKKCAKQPIKSSAGKRSVPQKRRAESSSILPMTKRANENSVQLECDVIASTSKDPNKVVDAETARRLSLGLRLK